MMKKPNNAFFVRTISWATVALACASLGQRALASSDLYAVGVAKVDITPSYPVRLNGFGVRRDESEGVTQRIWAKALAIGTDQDKPVVLLAIDSLGIRSSMVDEVARRLRDKAGIERSRIAVTFTHSHTTPKVNGACDTIFSSPIPAAHQKHIDRYTDELTAALEKVALAALADRKPARFQWATGSVGFAQNRRPQGGPVDHGLPTLVIRSAADDSIRAIYVSYACHCVTLSDNKISGDWAGFAQEAIERAHPGAIALVSIGCGSDANPSSGVTGANYAAAAEQGAEIAKEVDRLLQRQRKPITGAITTSLRNIKLPLNPLPSREELEALAAHENPAGYNARFQLAKLDRGESLQSAIDYPIQTWAFGDSLSMVFLAGEVCVDYSLRLKQHLDPARVWIHGYSNDFCCYVPSERLLREGGYGGGAEVVYFALANTLAPGLEDKIIHEVLDQVPKPFHQGDAPNRTLQPTDAEAAAAAIQTRDDFVVELVAAEPLIASPVAIDFGPDGRVWVAEMKDYSREADQSFEQSGRVKVLVDRDRDGRFDDATVFQDGLRFPTDVKVWRKGVIVCDAPDVLYLEDTNGDGEADLRKVLLTGFATHNPQARVNSLRWGLDNWLYGSCGLFGGEIRSFSGAEVSLGARDFRFRPDTGEIEPVTGKTQQGRARDDWGHWFGCENSSLGDHYPVSDHYLARNPHVVPPATEVRIPAGDDPNRLFPVGKPVLFQESGPPGRPTSVCGLGVYRDELLGPEFRGNIFVAEPVNCLVHRRVLSPRGVTFAGHRAEDEATREFAASTDSWFRPVQIRTGLDGCLWIVDMSRYVIEHPRFIPEEVLRTLNPMAGRETGRIYRIRPREATPRAQVPLDGLDTGELVTRLDSPNGPTRDLIHQMLLERADPSAVPHLEQLVAGGTRPESRLQALCALDGFNSLRAEVLVTALQDPHAAVRVHAIRLSAPLLGESDALSSAVMSLVADDHPEIQLQLAYSLGEWNDSRAWGTLAALAWEHHDEPYILAAVLSSVGRENADEILKHMRSRAEPRAMPIAIRDAMFMIATRLGSDDAIRATFAMLSKPHDGNHSAAQLENLAAFFESLSKPQLESLVEAGGNPSADVERVMSAAEQVIREADAGSQRLLPALRILSAGARHVSQSPALAGELLGPQNPPEVQQAAIQLLDGLSAQIASEALLENWSSYTPSLRDQVLDVFFSRDDLLPPLLSAIEAGEVAPALFDAAQRSRLLTHADPAIRRAATAAFDGAINSDRQEVIKRYREAAHSPGDAINGRALFRTHCAKCHRLEEHGYAVGPDLAALTNRTPESLLEAIFDPNRTIDQRYQNYLAITEEGRSYGGILASETANSITLVEQQGKQHVLARGALAELSNSGISFMPEGFEKDLSPDDLADLFAYLNTQARPPKKIAGNEPALVRPDDSGALWLLASNCEIYGQEITYEPTFKNIGYWHDESDYVAWTVELEQGGEFDVFLHWAAPDSSTPNAMILEGGDLQIRSSIESTGGWNRYETKQIGRIRLTDGRHQLVLRPARPLASRSLIDLRGVYLVRAAASGDAENTDTARLLRPPHPPDASTAILDLLDGLPIGTPAEYERIPAIWKAAIAAGQRNDALELQRLLKLALPANDEPLHHWQAVVLGGGIVNGLSQKDVWPRRRILELLDGNKLLLDRWARTIELAKGMADDPSVKDGTRYDALRILGADKFENAGACLVRYLAGGAGSELQMGAVSGLSDIESGEVAEALINDFGKFIEDHKPLAIEALLRTSQRSAALLKAIEAGKIPRSALTAEQFQSIAGAPAN